MALDSTPSPYAVSELCLSLTIILSRQLLTRSRQAHSGIWMKDHTNCHEIRNKTMGLLGVESNQVAGHQTGILAQAMGMRVVSHTPRLHMMTHGRTTNVKDLTTVAQQADFMVILDDQDLLENPASVQVKQSLQGQVLIHTSVGDDDGMRTKKFLTWLEKAVEPTKENELPVQLGGVAIVVPSTDFDEVAPDTAVETEETGELTQDEGYSTEDYASFKTGRYGRASTAVQKRRLAWRDQLRRLGVENVVLVPQFGMLFAPSHIQEDIKPVLFPFSPYPELFVNLHIFFSPWNYGVVHCQRQQFCAQDCSTEQGSHGPEAQPGRSQRPSLSLGAPSSVWHGILKTYTSGEAIEGLFLNIIIYMKGIKSIYLYGHSDPVKFTS